MQSRAGRIIIRTFTVIFGVIIILAAFIFRAYNYGFNYTKGEEIPDKVTITDEGLAYNIFSKEELDKYGVSGNMAAGNVNCIANIKGVHIHVHFAEVEEGVIRVELRSKKVPVNFIATKYGGGGHKLASGAQVKSFKDVENMIMDINDLLRETFNDEAR